MYWLSAADRRRWKFDHFFLVAIPKPGRYEQETEYSHQPEIHFVQELYLIIPPRLQDPKCWVGRIIVDLDGAAHRIPGKNVLRFALGPIAVESKRNPATLIIN